MVICLNSYTNLLFNMPSKNIVAIGGGGFGRSLGSLEIEKYIVSLSN